VPWLLFIPLGLVSGSIPFGLLLARSRGLDIRTLGSGNIGATNVARVLGPRLGLLCFALDTLKGFIPTFAVGLANGLVHASTLARPIDTEQAWLWLAVVAACVLGHMFSPFVRFRGGKGVATGFGAMLGLWPYLALPALGAFAVWIIVAAFWRYVSLASCLAALSLPLWLFVGSRISGDPALSRLTPFYIFTSVMGPLVVYRHRANIRRLISGTESRLGARIDPRPAPGPGPNT
jgi:acyl phosphate:glycerol-3-phosphate acyltransferase